MERLTEWNGEQTRHAYYPRCFKEPCYGSGCKIKDCPFETAVCERLAAYEDTGLEPEAVETVKLALAAKHIPSTCAFHPKEGTYKTDGTLPKHASEKFQKPDKKTVLCWSCLSSAVR